MVKNALLLTDAPSRTRSGSKLKKAMNRGWLLRMLETQRVIVKVVINSQGQLAIEHQDWEEYWSPVRQIGQANHLLDSLKSIWSAYVQRSFPAELRADYCYRYFQLLDKALEWRLAEPESELTAAALCCVLGFECFGISSAGANSALAAATSTVRNPAYLLTKLRNPNVLNSGEHLPLILAEDFAAGRLFYHYRQHRLSHDSDGVIISYLGVDHATRASSFRTIALLEQALAEGTDPFASERATRLARTGISDYLRAWTATRGDGDDVAIEIVDLGAGSGLVAARLCDEIAKYLTNLGNAPRFRIQFVDLSMSHPTRFFASSGIAKFVDNIEVVAADYREWLEQSSDLPNCDGIRLILMSRFFNNLSDFAIHSCKPGAMLEWAGFPIAHNLTECQPTYCLAPEGPGPERLAVSNVRVWLEMGRTFKQASLSPYFLGLKLASACSSKDIHSQILNKCVHFPVRSFRPTCLLTRQDDSVLGTLARKASLVVIQDTDMSATILKDHCHSTCLRDLMVLDTTRIAGLRGHFSYLIVHRDDPIVQSLPGERIW